MISRMMASVVLSILIIAVVVTGNEFSNPTDAEIDTLLKKLNKPALKSIQSPDGDIIDCVDINKQPAFDHPLLRNHTIQMRPSFYPEGWNINVSRNTEEQSSMVTQLWTTKGKCPENTIPIRRTRKEDILRAGSIERFGKKDPNNMSLQNLSNTNELHGTHSYAVVSADGKFHGAKATINVWKPYLQKRQEFSLSQMWIYAGTFDVDLNTIEVGWQVYPKNYGDYNTRLFIFWTRDAYKTGCYNHECAGFIQTSQYMVPGAVISPTSFYKGQQQELVVFVWKDAHSGDWWLGLNNNHVIGYWPRSLFTHLSNGATGARWGGEIINEKTGGHHTTTQMGSGHFADKGFKKASYIKNIEIVDETNHLRVYPHHRYFMTEENCYSLKFAYDSSWGSHIFFGGPGRNHNCP